MKIFRIFFKLKNDRPMSKSCGRAEVCYDTFKDAVTWAWETADSMGWRVAMVAELPTASVPTGAGTVLKHTWGTPDESDKSSQCN